jgi:hypothetical protein
MWFSKRFCFAQRRGLWVVAACIWASGIAGGMLLLAWHDASPGFAAPAPTHWPTGSQIALAERGATLVMFAHPHCPCTRASLGELEKLVARRAGLVDCWVVFFRPAETDQGWEASDLITAATAMPGVRVLSDVDGNEARRFHVSTSGHAVLYGCNGELLFSGGMTLARGHAGDNAGRSAIESLLVHATPPTQQTPVFGCPILVSDERQ